MNGRTNAGGGGALNFRVIGSNTAPANPKVNDLWVKTASITAFAFSATEPESPVPGMVWIEVAAASDAAFNMLKKNAAYTYPVFCKQYAGGVWSKVEAYVWNGEWVQFCFLKKYIFGNGATGLTWFGPGTNTSTHLVMQTIHTSSGGQMGDYGCKYSNEKVVIPPGFTKLSMKYYCSGDAQTNGTPVANFVLKTARDSDNWYNADDVVASVSMPYTTASRTVSINIPESLRGQELLVGAYFADVGDGKYVKEYNISEIWFE